MSDSAPENPLSERAQLLFKNLVEHYIRDGQPVGSRTLSRGSGLDLSPATVRNVMADLEDAGLLRSPHTSAGRIPTTQGFRLFVDTMLTVEPIPADQEARVRGRLEGGEGRDGLVESASGVLSSLTHLASMVTLPSTEHARFRHIEFLSLSEDRVLVILVSNDSDVENRIIRTGRRYSEAELQQAANYLNEVFAGRDLSEVRGRLLGELREARRTMNEMMAAAIDMAEKAFTPGGEELGLVVSGQTHLMEYGELARMETLRQLFEAFRTKRDILHLFDECIRARGVQIFIGDESGYDVLGECSVVTAPYQVRGEVVGVLGVIGPTRMAYDRVIPVVDLTARLLGAALNPRS